MHETDFKCWCYLNAPCSHKRLVHKPQMNISKKLIQYIKLSCTEHLSLKGNKAEFMAVLQLQAISQSSEASIPIQT